MKDKKLHLIDEDWSVECWLDWYLPAVLLLGTMAAYVGLIGWCFFAG